MGLIFNRLTLSIALVLVTATWLGLIEPLEAVRSILIDWLVDSATPW